MNKYGVSIITPAYNSEKTIKLTIDSVVSQHYGKIEHIVVDGGSTDQTVEIVKKYGEGVSRCTRAPDHGIFDAMNKGIEAASGDIIGILNADDFYAHDTVIEKVVTCMDGEGVDSCYGDLMYVGRDDTNKVVRYWKSGGFSKENFRRGWMPPHPTFFVQRRIYERFGAFNKNFRIGADYELMFRFLYRFGISTRYIPEILVKMRTGGRSQPGFLATPRAAIENYRAWKVNGVNPNLLTFILKPASKLLQYVNARRYLQPN